MPNIRILYDNKADEALTLAADSTAGSLVAANLLTDIKTEVHRSTATSVTYTVTWTNPVLMNMVALAFCNLTSAATMNVSIYTNAADPSPVLTTGAQLCCAYQPFGLWQWGMLPLGVNAFSYGGGVYARSYFAATYGRKLVIEIADASNSAGYLEAARLITGAYWSPEKNPSFPASVAPNSNTKHFRSDAGDLRTERRPKSRTLKINLEHIDDATDRQRVYELLWGNGMTQPVFVSLFPEDADPALEQSHQIYGKLNDSELSHPDYGLFAAPLKVEEI